MHNTNKLRFLIDLLRPKQWIKNVFVLAPLFFSGYFLDPLSVKSAVGATILFCIASSAAYIVNDIFDINNDRMHPEKSFSRPLAAGFITIRESVFLLILCYGLISVSFFFVPKVTFIVLIYIALNFLYSIFLKKQPVIDIFTIAFGFVLRVYAGGVAIGVPISSWMFITTLCLALYLAAIKRRQELVNSSVNGRKVLKDYSAKLMDRYAEMSGTGTLIFYSMFVMSSKPSLVITIPLVLFGLFRYWFIVDSKGAGESPSEVLVRDIPLILTLAVWLFICIGALQ